MYSIVLKRARARTGLIESRRVTLSHFMLQHNEISISHKITEDIIPQQII